MSIYGQRNELDLVTVQRDDEQLDEIARRQSREPVAGGALGLLAALTYDVDAGLAELLAAPLRVPLASETPEGIVSLADARRRRAARAVTAALIVTGLVSVSGVSAAVTGDPFTPYRKVISAVTGEDRQRPQPRGVEDDPVVQRQVLSIEEAIGAGQLGRANAGVEKLRATLADMPGGAALAAVARLAALEEKLARAVAKDTRTNESTRGVQRPAVDNQPAKAGSKVVAPGQGSSGDKTADPPVRKPRAGEKQQEVQGRATPSSRPTEENAKRAPAESAAEAADDRKASRD